MSKEVKKPELNIDVILAVDLSSSHRLATATIVTFYGSRGKPIFFKAIRVVNKIERILKEVSNLERKIKNIANQIHATRSKSHRDILYHRLKHLFGEEKIENQALKKGTLKLFCELID